MRTVAVVLAFVACVHVGLWASLRTKETAPDFTGQIASISYAPFVNSSHPDSGERPTVEQIRADLKAIAPYTRAIRTYSSTGGGELVAPIAAEFGLKVTVGAWIDKNQDRNEREIRSALDLARRYSNVNAIVVGNETMLRNETSVEDLIKLIQQVKRSSPVPVTTGENWTAWIDHPELASAVDFIAAHILPYWAGFDASQAVDRTIGIYDDLRRIHPGKRIVIAEFGWPSAGYNFHNASPGRMEQAEVIRDFVARAEAYGIDYNLIEGIDQPWKTMEGGVGPYWGLFDASRQAKFSWTGPITDPDYIKRAGLAVLLSLLLSLPILAISGVTLAQAVTLAAAANVAGAWFAAIVAFWKGHYFVPGAAFALGLGIVLLVPLVVIALARIDEIAAIAFGRPPRRLAASPPLVPDAPTPKVSIHVPACCEPPDMLRATLDALAKLDYSNLECVVVINNTPDPAFWRPIEEHCLKLGERFKFVRIENHVGYKAGALRLALENTAADAEIVGVIDADYVVQPDWLKDLVPLFADPDVGLVQSPQDHRDGDRSVMHRAMNTEYAGFFDIGMVQRNEFNAIIVHGTMCLIRRAAIEAAGGWSSATIVEDADLGLTLLEQGWTAHYTNRRYGYGLLPDTFDAYKRQRHRWAFGGLQILRKHWQELLPWSDGLSREQKREYGLGWLNWLGAESHRRRRCAAQHRLGAGGGFCQYCRAGSHSNHSDPGGVRGLDRAFCRALSVAGAGNARANARRRLRRHGGAMDGGARRRHRHLQGAPPLPAHLEGRQQPQGPRFPGLLGGGDRRTSHGRRPDARGDELQGSSRNQHLRDRPRGAEPAVPGGGRHRTDRGYEAQLVRLLARRRGAPPRIAAAIQSRRRAVRRRAVETAGREPRRGGAVTPYPASAVSASRTQYEVPTGIASSLKS